MAKGKTKKGENLLIQHILSRFFESQYKTEDFSTLKELLDLPITALKDVDKIEAAQVHEIFKVNTIDDLSKLNPINPIEDLFPTEPMDNEKFEKVCKKIIDNTLEAIPDFEAFRNHIAVAKMVERAWSKRTTYNRKKDTKVICVGLDNAGKTAILTGLGGKLGINELSKLKPTKKIERRKISTDSLDLHVWDLGGQKDYRRGYLEKPEVYFIGTDLLIYVIDIQDPERFNESFEYLIEIMDVVKILGENPYILGFMHKSDPDILDDPDFQLNTEYVADKMNYHLRNYGYEYDIYTTSIYNFFTSEPKFSRFIKETLSDKESLNNPVVRKIEGMGDILDSTLNAVVTLASSMGEQIAQLGRRIDELEVKIERTFMPLPKTTAEKRAQKLMPSHSPQVIYTKKTPSGQNITPNGKNAAPIDSRLTIMNELQSLFQAKKNLDDTTQLSKLGTLGKKFKKSKATKKTKKTKTTKKKSKK